MKTLNVELKFNAANDYQIEDMKKVIKYITNEWIYDIIHKADYELIDYTIKEEKSI